MRSCEVALGEIADQVTRIAKDRSSLPVYSISKHDGFVRSDEYFKKQVHSADTSSYKVVQPGDFAFSPIHLDEGSIALANQPGLISPMYKVFEVDRSRCDTEYLIRALKSPKLIRIYGTLGDGSVHRRRSVSFDRLSEVRLPLPSLTEQRRIAKILNKADELRRKQKRALKLLDGLSHSIFLEIFGDPAEPSSHQTRSLGEMLIEVGSGWSPICLDRPANDSEPGVLKLGAITSGLFLHEQNKALPPDLVPKSEAEIRSGEILFCRKNTKELVGSSAYIWETRANLYMSDLIFRLSPNTNIVDPIFLQAQLSLPSQRRNLSDMAGGAAGSMPNISKARLKELMVFVPELRAQKRFAQIVRQNRATWSAQLRSATAANMLLSSLQHRAFTGQL